MSSTILNNCPATGQNTAKHISWVQLSLRESMYNPYLFNKYWCRGTRLSGSLIWTLMWVPNERGYKPSKQAWQHIKVLEQGKKKLSFLFSQSWKHFQWCFKSVIAYKRAELPRSWAVQLLPYCLVLFTHAIIVTAARIAFRWMPGDF